MWRSIYRTLFDQQQTQEDDNVPVKAVFTSQGEEIVFIREVKQEQLQVSKPKRVRFADPIISRENTSQQQNMMEKHEYDNLQQPQPTPNRPKPTYHKTHKLCGVKMTRWEWTSWIALAVCWFIAIAFYFGYSYFYLPSQLEQTRILVEKLEHGAAPGAPPQIMSSFVKHVGRESGWDGMECPGCSFTQWYGSHATRTAKKHKNIYVGQ
jgi:hypothetical protein